MSRSVARDLRRRGARLRRLPIAASCSRMPLPQRSRIRSLQPGTAAPAPTALAPSLSTPSLNSGEQAELPASESDKTCPRSAARICRRCQRRRAGDPRRASLVRRSARLRLKLRCCAHKRPRRARSEALHRQDHRPPRHRAPMHAHEAHHTMGRPRHHVSQPGPG